MGPVKKCQSCGKAPAKHQIKRWENNLETDFALCDACAEEKGYTLDPEQLLYLVYRSLPDDHRNEFLIFYIQPLADLGIALKDTSENQDTEREKAIVAAARERAIQAFTILTP